MKIKIKKEQVQGNCRVLHEIETTYEDSVYTQNRIEQTVIAFVKSCEAKTSQDIESENT